MYFEQIRYQKEFVYNHDTKTLVDSQTNRCYPYPGVNKICNFGSTPLMKKLEQQYGTQRAKEIQKNSIIRGNRIHKNLEVSKEKCPLAENSNSKPKRIINKNLKVADHSNIIQVTLGEVMHREVFVYTKFSDSYEVIGTIDAIYKGSDGELSLVEYKTKSNRKTWAKYSKSNMETHLKQIAAYQAMFYFCYGITIKNCYLGIRFASGEAPLLNKISEQDIRLSFNKFYENLVSFYQNSAS